MNESKDELNNNFQEKIKCYQSLGHLLRLNKQQKQLIPQLLGCIQTFETYFQKLNIEAAITRGDKGPVVPINISFKLLKS